MNSNSFQENYISSKINNDTNPAVDNSAAGNRDIVVIMFDQLSAKWLEWASKLGLCPNIERLRRAGTTFPNAFCSTPICMPARSSMVTGMSSRRHGVLTNGYALNQKIPTYMRILQNHGYHTGGFGKFHLYPEVVTEEMDYRQYGFDVAMKSEDWDKWTHNGFLKNNHVGRPGYFFTVKDETKSQTTWITVRALSFISSADLDKPLYAFISYVEPHPPYTPPVQFLSKVIPESLPPAVSPLWKDQQNIPIGLFEKRIKRKAYFHSNEEQFSNPKEFWSTARHHYFADIVHLDEQVGKILDTIEKTGRSGGSYIILTADHGDMLGDHGFFGKGWPHYDSCIRIPMIISGPKLQKGQIRHELVQLEDVFYTILEMAGNLSSNTCSVETTREAELYWAPGSHAKYVHTPQPNLPRQSRSMLSMCRGEHVADWRKSVYIESYDEPLGDAWTRTIRSEKHRYTYFPRGGGEQLFYLASDPDEIRNIAGDAGSREIVKQMRNELLEKIIEQDYPCTVRDCRILGMY